MSDTRFAWAAISIKIYLQVPDKLDPSWLVLNPGGWEGGRGGGGRGGDSHIKVTGSSSSRLGT